MTTVTGLTADRMLAIEGASVISGNVSGDNLILVKHNGQQINAGNVRGPAGTPGAQGPQGPPGSSASSIPGELRMWAGNALPAAGTFGLWVWADGAVYPNANYPIAAGNIAPAWRTFGGASDPGPANFRVPDMRGLTPMGMDAMPGGARANRMTRAVSIVLAGRTGEELHAITIAEMATHNHGVTDPGHEHNINWQPGSGSGDGAFADSAVDVGPYRTDAANYMQPAATGIFIQHVGGGNGHENVQPTVFIPYIVCLQG